MPGWPAGSDRGSCGCDPPCNTGLASRGGWRGMMRVGMMTLHIRLIDFDLGVGVCLAPGQFVVCVYPCPLDRSKKESTAVRINSIGFQLCFTRSKSPFPASVSIQISPRMPSIRNLPYREGCATHRHMRAMHACASSVRRVHTPLPSHQLALKVLNSAGFNAHFC